jgi:hypothetical protein
LEIKIDFISFFVVPQCPITEKKKKKTDNNSIVEVGLCSTRQNLEKSLYYLLSFTKPMSLHYFLDNTTQHSLSNNGSWVSLFAFSINVEAKQQREH